MKKRHVKYNVGLAKYFASKPLYFDKEDKKPQIRKAAEQPYQQTRAEMWGEVVDTLCDLLFIEAKCRAGLTFDLLKDYQTVHEGSSGTIPEIEEENNRMERINKLINEMIEYCEIWSERIAKKNREGGLTGADPVMPETLSLMKLLVNEEITTISQIGGSHINYTELSDIYHFVKGDAFLLNNYCSIHSFVQQQAYNHYPYCFINEKASKISRDYPMFLRKWEQDIKVNSINNILSRMKAEHFIACIAIPTNEKYVLSGGFDHLIRHFNIDTGDCSLILDLHKEPVLCLGTSSNGTRFVSASIHSIKVWDYISNNIAFAYVNDDLTWSFNSASITSDGRRIYTVASNKILGWEVNSHEPILVSESAKKYACIAINYGGNRGYIGCADGSIYEWDLVHNTLVKEIGKHDDCIFSVHVTADGKYLLSGTEDELKYWNTDEQVCLKTIKTKRSEIMNLWLTSNGEYVLYAGTDGNLSLWDVNNDTIREGYKLIDSLVGLTLSIDGKYLFVSGLDGDIYSFYFNDIIKKLNKN